MPNAMKMKRDYEAFDNDNMDLYIDPRNEMLVLNRRSVAVGGALSVVKKTRSETDGVGGEGFAGSSGMDKGKGKAGVEDWGNEVICLD